MREIRRSVALSLSLCFVLALVAFASAPAVAESHAEKMPGELADLWMMWPKAGHEMQFEASITAHVAWRKSAGEGWVWEAYQPQVGTDLSYYIYRSGDHRWADFDAQAAWEVASKAGADFNKNVAPHIDRFEHYIFVEDLANSNWKPAEDYRYFRVTDYELKSGKAGAVREAIGAINKGLVAGGWAGSYAISRPIGGAGNGLTIVTPYRSFAEMEDPKPSLTEVLAKGAGSSEAAEAALQSFREGVSSSNVTIYVSRPDLSTSK